MTKTKTGAVWEDKEVLFDLPFAYLRLRPGEKIFDRIEPIEDTKGNSGTKGRMVVTNLRIIWHSLASPRINLSIGLNCVLSTNTKVVNSGLRGTTQALYLLAAYKTSRYEFVFTNLSPNCIRHYTSVVGVHKAYAASRMYRDLKLRTAVIQNKQLKVLPLEKYLDIDMEDVRETYLTISVHFHQSLKAVIIQNKQLYDRKCKNGQSYIVLDKNVAKLFFKVWHWLSHLVQICLREHSIWNLSSDSGNLGSMVISNVRVVWHADVNDAFNVSMPYITIESISIRDSKFGEALVFVVRPSSGGYVLGFRADPPERLRPLLEELKALHQAYNEKPIFGVEMSWGTEASKPTADDIEELEEIGEPRGEMGPTLYLASQLAQNKTEAEIQPVYSPYLGLAIEPLKEGFTLKSLFEVQTSS